MKMTPLVFVNVFLTVVLVTSLFFTTTGRVGSNHGANAAGYDPWLDYDENGIINMLDLYYTAQSFGTMGDSTKNVNVTSFAVEQFGHVLHLGELNVSWTDYANAGPATAMFPCNGYDEMFVYVDIVSAMSGTYNATIHMDKLLWTAKVPMLWEGRWEWGTTAEVEVVIKVDGTSSVPECQLVSDASGVKVKGPFCILFFRADNPSIPTGWIVISIDVYLAKR